MTRLLEIFETLTAIPRCSGNTTAALEYLIGFCRQSGATVKTDAAGNLLAAIGTPKICFQSHYDMVCIGDQPPVTLREGEWLRAKGGTLGADNGIGIAVMLWLIERGVSGEYLFTNDEEIGLIGANALETLPVAPLLINLDSEEEGVVTLGCAGGADFFLSRSLEFESIDTALFDAYEIRAKGCIGGHSGVDIHRGIAGALAEVCGWLFDHSARLVSLEGGERVNAIPREAKAIAWLPKKTVLKAAPHVEFKPCAASDRVIAGSNRLLAALAALPHGVLDWDNTHNVVCQSSNFALAKTADDRLEITLSVRGNTPKALEDAGRRVRAAAFLGGLEARSEGKYPPWPPEGGALADRMAELMRQAGLKPSMSVIHAGLECAVLKTKLPHTEMVSVGPTIRFPHSDRECVHLPSVERFLNLIQKAAREL
ncbi:MAG: hypothetical protein AB7E49_08780 [Campylobacterales bacterium]